MAFFAYVALVRIRAEILERRLQALRFAQAAAAVPAAGRVGDANGSTAGVAASRAR